MDISSAAFARFSQRMSKIRTTAASAILDILGEFSPVLESDPEQQAAFIDLAYGVVTKYGEASGALSAEMYDAIAELSGVIVPSAIPAETPPYWEIRKTVDGVLKQSHDPNMMAGAIGRQIKKVGTDTMLQNARRDGAQCAWIPHGDSCPFCIMLASRGWEDSNYTVEHLHANCDCEYCVRFDGKTNVKGYDPDKYKAMYDNAEGDNWREKLKSMRSEFDI